MKKIVVMLALLGALPLYAADKVKVGFISTLSPTTASSPSRRSNSPNAICSATRSTSSPASCFRTS
jgi:hypothetical protein